MIFGLSKAHTMPKKTRVHLFSDWTERWLQFQY